MKAIWIVASSRHLGTCRSCGAPVEWAQVAASAKAKPFNPPIVLEPTLMEGELVPVDMNRTTSHFATCPQAQQWRKQR